MGQVNTLHPGNPVNDPTPKTVRTSSKIPMVFRQFASHRFGDIQPILGLEYVPKDDIQFRSKFDLRTYTLKSPLMSDMFYKQDFFSVDMQAILPKNWEKIYTNPLIGDDVQPIVNSFISGSQLRTLILGSMYAFADFIDTASVGPEEEQEEIEYHSLFSQLKGLLFASLWFSRGSVISTLEYHLTNRFHWSLNLDGVTPDKDEFDLFFQERINLFIEAMMQAHPRTNGAFYVQFNNIGEDSIKYCVHFDSPFANDDPSGIENISFRRFIEMAYQNLDFTYVVKSDDYALYNVLTGEERFLLSPSDSENPEWFLSENFPDFNFGKVGAYQLVCSHFYSNDHIDYIYSADLYKQLIWSYIMADVASDDRSFSYNGVMTEYDSLSGAMMLHQQISLSDVTGVSGLLSYKLAYWTALLSFRKSLRFVDYFTGSKAYPLAVGDVSVAVNDNLVSVIDITKNIQRQRFLNSVNRTGRKVQDYISGIFGIAPDPDHHNPQWLAQTNDPITLNEVDNTGEAQQTENNSVTGILRANGNDYVFRFQTALPGYLIGVCYFDIPRAYTDVYLRENMHRDRFDMFNPDMQFIGDQDISSAEIVDAPQDQAFAYTLRHMEYKQRVDSAVGSFAIPEFMPGYCFLADQVKGLPAPRHISPDYIRSKNVEMDEFYLSLLGYGLADYFHFQIKHVHEIDADRPMAFAPSIL